MCPGWASPEKRSRPVYARWHQVHTYPVHNTNPTLKPRRFLLPCRLLLPYRFFCSTLKPRLVEYVQTFIAAQIFLFYTKTKISRTHAPRADVYCRTDGTDFFSGVYELETRFARIIRTKYAAANIREYMFFGPIMGSDDYGHSPS